MLLQAQIMDTQGLQRVTHSKLMAGIVEDLQRKCMGINTRSLGLFEIIFLQQASYLISCT